MHLNGYPGFASLNQGQKSAGPSAAHPNPVYAQIPAYFCAGAGTGTTCPGATAMSVPSLKPIFVLLSSDWFPCKGNPTPSPSSHLTPYRRKVHLGCLQGQRRREKSEPSCRDEHGPQYTTAQRDCNHCPSPAHLPGLPSWR